jgi:hypothetical protein
MSQIVFPMMAGEYIFPLFRRSRAVRDVAYFQDDVEEAKLEREAQALYDQAVQIRSRTETESQ